MVFSDCHDIIEILLKVALSIIKPNQTNIFKTMCFDIWYHGRNMSGNILLIYVQKDSKKYSLL